MIPERLRRRAAGLRHWADGVPAQWPRLGCWSRSARAASSTAPGSVREASVRSGSTPTPCGACSTPSRARADIRRPPTHLNGTTMSPAEALYATSRGPTRSVAFMGRRPDLAETTERRTEDLDETSNCPIALDALMSPERRPAAPLEGPGRDRQKPSKSPASSNTGAGQVGTVARPLRDLDRTHAGPPRSDALRAVLRGLGAAFDPVGTWNFADVAEGSVSCPCGAASGACAFCAGRLPAQRPPEGPGHSGAKRVNVLRGYDIPCLEVPEAPTTGCSGPRRAPETLNVALHR